MEIEDGTLGEFLRKVVNWDWAEFIEAEMDNQYTSNQSVIFALIRACAMQKMDAIRLALNRLDGKLKTPIKLEYPKVYILYPYAKVSANDKKTDKQIPNGIPIENQEITPYEEPDLATMGLRQTLEKMSELPRSLPNRIVELSFEAERWKKSDGKRPFEIPKVKSVVCAHLLVMAQSRKLDAITEVFDSIDGKLAETFKILGEDIYVVRYDDVAPEGAVLNDDGVLQLEGIESQDMWAEKLARGGNRNV